MKAKIGQTYGGLTCLSFYKQPYSGQYRTMANAQCICGRICNIRPDVLITYFANECICPYSKDTDALILRNDERAAWRRMITRCYNPKNPSYNDYGGRGIRVSDSWMNFDNFFLDMGKRPSKNHSLDREDNNGNYEKGNCRWATPSQQANNKRTTEFYEYKGDKMTLPQWAKKIGIKHPTLLQRVKGYGWSIEQAIETPIISKQNARNWKKLKTD